MVYVLNINKNPIMPCTEAKARKLLKRKLAKVIQKEPFVIQLLFECENETQPIALGVDAGSKHIGLSATTVQDEVFAAHIELRHDIVELLSTRRQYRRARRNKLRYRESRFNNRSHSKPQGWLPPSIQQKIKCHLDVINKIHFILPISAIVVEVAAFDIQKIKNPQICGDMYQYGDQNNFWNVREYVLHRDGHACQYCKGSSKDRILNVHHIESRKTGGNAPNNLVTLCKTCHQRYHDGEIELSIPTQRSQHFRDAAFMNIMKWKLYYSLKDLYPNVNMTFGYITKQIRISSMLPKDHCIDARCISGNYAARPLTYFYHQRKVRCHNRKIHKGKLLKGGVKRMNQTAYVMYGFRLFDKVEFNKQIGFIFARRKSGYFDVRTFNGDIISPSVNYKKLKLIETKKNYLTAKVYRYVQL